MSHSDELASIYLDNNATTLVDPQVASVMCSQELQSPLNPSSIHANGRAAKALLSKARATLAAYFCCPQEHIYFTSGGTESMNTLIFGLASTLPKGQVITTKMEHACVQNPLLHLQSQGWDIHYVNVGAVGAPSPQQIENAITKNTRFIVLSLANSETGVQIELESIADIADQRAIPLLIDGVAALGKMPLSLAKGVSAIGFSSHKIHGPKGVGCIIKAPSLPLSPLMLGGGQEKGLRSGTENLTGILGFAKAIECLHESLSQATKTMLHLRRRFETTLQRKTNALINGEGTRLSNTVNLHFPSIDGETFLIFLDMQGIAASHGSACASGALEPSRTLLSMGYSREYARSCLRFSLSRFTTEQEIDKALLIMVPYVQQLQSPN